MVYYLKKEVLFIMFILISTIAFVLLSSLFGSKKNGNSMVILFFIILEIADFIKYGFTGSLAVISVFNFIVLIGTFSGIVKAKGDLYLSEKYDDRHKNDK